MHASIYIYGIIATSKWHVWMVWVINLLNGVTLSNFSRLQRYHFIRNGKPSNNRNRCMYIFMHTYRMLYPEESKRSTIAHCTATGIETTFDISFEANSSTHIDWSLIKQGTFYEFPSNESNISYFCWCAFLIGTFNWIRSLIITPRNDALFGERSRFAYFQNLSLCSHNNKVIEHTCYIAIYC